MEINRALKGALGPILKSTTPRSAEATDLYVVTGTVEVLIYGICTTSLTSHNGSTVEVGVANATASLIAQTLGTLIDQDHVWASATLAECVDLPDWRIIAAGADIIETVATDVIDAGAITYYCYWKPISAGAILVAA